MENKKIEEFKKIYLEIKELIDSFPKEKRDEILFDKWSMKDVISHLNHWAKHDILCLISLSHLEPNKEPYWVPNIDDYNKQGVESRKNKSWEEVYDEFNFLLNKLILEFENLPKENWNKRFWESRDFTPSKFLDIEIKHYKEEHIPQIREYSNYEY